MATKLGLGNASTELGDARYGDDRFSRCASVDFRMRRPTSRPDTSEGVDSSLAVTRNGTAGLNSSDIESAIIKARVPDAEARPETEVGRFGRDLATHTFFSMMLVCLILTGLWLEKVERDPSTPPSQPTLEPKLQGVVPYTLENDEFSTLDEQHLESVVDRQRASSMAMRRAGTVMETDQNALRLTRSLQNATRRLLVLRYGPGPTYRLMLRLLFPRSMGGNSATLTIETAPISVMPHAIHVFLDSCVTKRLRTNENWAAAFHRNAGHVLQAFVRARDLKGLAFQEYDPSFPHRKYTLGFAGRPG